MNILTLEIFLLSLCVAWIHVACKIDDTAAENGLTGKDLLDMGLKFNKPLLQLFGKALMNIECRGHACSPWTEWSDCDIFVGQFGVKKRSRLCGGHADCSTETTDRNETETQICRQNRPRQIPQQFPSQQNRPRQIPQQCPSQYELTNGFCLRVYKDVKKTKADAELNCVGDGGHLVNINTAQKWAAVGSLLVKYKITDLLYIDGQRKDTSSPWTFTYETDITGYTNWASSEPDNGSGEVCLMARKYSSYDGLLDGYCSTRFKLNFVCEII